MKPSVQSCRCLHVVYFLVIILSSASVRAALLSYEGFDYPSGDTIIGKTGGTGFSQAWQLNSSGGVYTNQGTSLKYVDSQGNSLTTIGGSLFLQGSTIDAANSAAAQPNRLLGYVRGTNGTDAVSTWISFLAVRQGPTTNHPSLPDNPYPRSANLSLYNNFSSSNVEKLALGNTALTTSNVVSLLPQGNLANAKPSSVSFSRTNFIVVRIDHVAGSTLDNVYLFVNPLLGTEPDVASADTNSLSQFDFTFNRIRPFAGGDRSTSASSPYAELVLDEIRIGETYADVAPFSPALHISRNGSNVTLTWSGTFNLQAADAVSGPFVTIGGASSGYTTQVSGSQRYFRLSN